MNDILLVAPTPRVYENSCRTVKNENIKNVDVKEGVLEDGLRIAEKFIADGGKVIISRGGTYSLIKSKVSVPVVEIKVSTADCIEAYNKIADTKESIGVIGFKNVIYGFEALSNLCDCRFCFKEITDERQIPKAVEECKKAGIKRFVGDVLVEKAIKELDCVGIAVDSTDESISQSIRMAKLILENSEHHLKKNYEIQTVINSVHDCVIYTDKKGHFKIVNKAAERILNTHMLDNIKALLGIESFPEREVSGRIYNIDDVKYAVNIVPIRIDNDNDGYVFSFQKSDEISKLEHSLRRSMNKNGFTAKYNFEDIIHVSQNIDDLIDVAKKYAAVDAPILINGESGTGKELICQSIHNYSSRKNQPFVAVNCAAIAPSLIESEFFGYDAGAFTGAKKTGKAGVFELAHKGTIFLDEISELPLELQGRLLRVLQEKQIVRLGGDKVIPVDVRIICASNKNLRELTEKNEFRTDLYFRIGILKLYIPPLRERQDDIGALANYYLKEYNQKYDHNVQFTDSQIKMLYEYSWPGNIRELRNEIERYVITDGNVDILINRIAPTEEKASVVKSDTSADLRTAKDKFEKDYIKNVLDECDWKVQKAAERLGIHRSVLYTKIEKYNIKKCKL